MKQAAAKGDILNREVCLPLTERQERVFRVVLEFLAENGYPPTLSEICAVCSICNEGSADRALRGLIQKGYLSRRKGEHRGLRPGPAAQAYSLRRGWPWPGTQS